MLGAISARTGLTAPSASWQPVPLAALAATRENNFTLLRLVMAWLVIVDHSWQVVVPGGIDPLSRLMPDGTRIGSIAVNGFFLISGFLVTGSAVRHGLVEFVAARFLRIFPALFTCLVLSVFVIGPLVTSLPLGTYFSSSATWSYLANLKLWPELHWLLPGVFRDHPRTVVNIPLWTLPLEATCYVWLAAIAFLGGLRTRLRANLTILALFFLGYRFFDALPLFAGHPGWDRRAAYFLLGMFAWVNRSHIPMHPILAGLALLAAAFAVVLPIPSLSFELLFAVCLPYLILYAAYCVRHVDLDSRLGDLSYGFYIYAFPIQQVVFWPGQSPWINLALSTAAVSVLAYMSWHGIEKRALAWRRFVR